MLADAIAQFSFLRTNIVLLTGRQDEEDELLAWSMGL